jgi:lambda family phage portal protein
MGLLESAKSWLGFGRGDVSTPIPVAIPPPEVAVVTQRSAGRHAFPRMGRSFAAGEVNNLTASFTPAQVSMNDDLERNLQTMRSRSRQLAKDNDYFKKFTRMAMNNIVGPNGFVLSVPCKRPDGSVDMLDRAVLEKAFGKWCKRNIGSVTGRLSFKRLLRLVVRHWVVDGEAIIRMVEGKGFGPFGFQLQVIDPALLDHTLRADLGAGSKIRMGVEFDSMGRILAYHFVKDKMLAYADRHERVLATEIIHLFIEEEAGQVRGVPWAHSAIRRLNDLGGFEEAAVIAARVGASNMGFFVPPADQTGSAAGSFATDKKTDEKTGEEQLIRDAEPGQFQELPAGYGFEKFDPDYPHQNFDPFVKAMLRGAASGIGADYPTLANDLENVNFSSIRSGKLETQDEWMCLQDIVIEALLEPIWPRWLTMAFVSGQLGSLPISKFDKYDCAVWQPRRWTWVDPMKDVQAKALEINSGFSSISQVLRELGRDPETIATELEADIKRFGPLLGALAKAMQTSAPAADASVTD